MAIDNCATSSRGNTLFRSSSTRNPNSMLSPPPNNNERNTKSIPVGVGPFNRTLTMNRLDMQRHRQQQRLQQQATTNGHSLQRNLSSLGHYPIRSNHLKQPIYAPASIASPNECKPMTNGGVTNYNESQHYAATSYRTHSIAGDSMSRASGRESVLGNLLDRFGTIRRKAKFRSSLSRKSNSSTPNEANTPKLPLEPEIYASGKKKIEAQDIYAEGQQAIDGNQIKRTLQHTLLIDESLMSEGETRTIIESESAKQSDYCELVDCLTNWINDELAHQRIIVQDLQEDLYDGQILGKLIEKLHNIKLDVVEVTQNEFTQRYKLRTVLDTINRVFTIQARWVRIMWSVEGIHAKNLVEILHLLIALAIFYQAPFKIPPNVNVRVLVVQKHKDQLVKRSHEVQLTNNNPHRNIRGQTNQLDSLYNTKHRDAFDTLCEYAPDKLIIVKQSLANFVNRHLNKINMSCFTTDSQQLLEPDQFSDGLLLVFLIASLEDYFVPLGSLFTAPASTRLIDPNNNHINMDQTAIGPTSYINTLPIHKLHNVNIAFQLLEEADIMVYDKVRPEDIVSGDLKSVLRVLYAIFSRYKHL